MEKVTLNRQKLYDLVWSVPLRTLAKKYVISDNGLRKICVRMNIPLPQLGYWQKIKYHKVRAKRLPKDNPGDEEITLNIRGENDGNLEHILSIQRRLEKEIESDTNLPLTVPEKLKKPDKLIITAKKGLKEDKVHYSQYNRILHTYMGQINIRVAPNNVSRTLRLMDALIKLLRARGHNISVGNSRTYVNINGEEIEIYVREKLKMVKENDSWGTTQYYPNGVLALIYGDIHKKEIKDDKKPLETKLAKILAKFELESKRIKEERARWEKIREQQKEIERIEKEAQERKEKEYRDFMDLLYQANRWHQTKILRCYIESIKKNNSGVISEEKRSWLDWAKQKVDWFDPLINHADPFLTEKDKKKFYEFKKM